MPPAQLPSLVHVHLMPVDVAEPVTRTTPRHKPDPPGDPSRLRNPSNDDADLAKPLIAPLSPVGIVCQAPSTQSTPLCTICAAMSSVAKPDDSSVPVHAPARLGMVGSAGCVGVDGGVVFVELEPHDPLSNAPTTSAAPIAVAISRRGPMGIYRPIVSEVQTEVFSQCIAMLPPGPERFGAISNVSCSTVGLMGSLRSVTRPRSASGWYRVWNPLGSLLTMSVH